MKLHMHPVSTTSRPILFFLADQGIEGVETNVVDLMTGEHHQPAFAALNPNRMVPVLEDGDFVLTESSAILKYLADVHDSPTYPKELKARARVHEAMDWLSSNLMKELAYNLAYPQLFPHHKREDEAHQRGVLSRGSEQTKHWLGGLDGYFLGDRPWLAGDAISIADYQGSGLISLGEAIGCDYSAYPNVSRWLAAIKARPGWAATHDVYEGFVGSLAGQSFQAL